MKEHFEIAEIELISFDQADVITTSPEGNDPFYEDDPL